MSLFKSAYAHCDIPCGIYETDTLLHSAETCKRMIQTITQLGEIDTIEKNNSFVRCVLNKEKHAQKVKKEIYILWSDYFKPEHFEKYPDLHDKLLRVAKQASTVKQTVSLSEAEKLGEMAHEISHLFADTKN